ncbi:MAG: hypothetical protein ABIP33_11055 [Pseudolysinimonas sp.]
MVEPTYIRFEGSAFGRLRLRVLRRAHLGSEQHRGREASNPEATSIDSSWDGSDEMDGEGSAELQPDGSLNGEIQYRHGDQYAFIARR